MKNLKLTQFMKMPNKMYIKITKEELDSFFSTGYTKLVKEKCATSYNLFDFKQGILEAHYLAKSEENRHTVDLMLYALSQIEKLETNVLSLESTIWEFEQRLEQATKIEQNNLIQDKKEM